MRTGAAVMVVFVGLVGCTGHGSKSSPQGVAAPAAPRGSIVYFSGVVDTAAGTMTITYESPTGTAIHTTATVLPNGTGTNQITLHTLPGTVAWDATADQLVGQVSAINHYTGAVGSLTAYIDATSPSTVSSNGPWAYGAVAAGGSSAAQTWVFTDPTAANFTFSGHVEGDAPGTGALSANPSLLDAGAVPMEKVGPTVSTTVTNVSGAQVSTMYMNASGLVPTSTDCIAYGGLAPGQTCTIGGYLDCTTVTQSGAVSGSFQLKDSSSGTTILSLPVTGTCSCLSASTACVRNADCCSLLCSQQVCVSSLGGDAGASSPITELAIPTASAGPTGIALGPDGNVWFTEDGASKIGVVTPAGAFTEYALPQSNSQPIEIAAGGDGNMWFTESGSSNKIGKITTAGAITEFSVPTSSSEVWGITKGPDGNVWFTEETANKIGKISPAGAITELTVPTAGSLPHDITTGPDGNLWFTERGANKIGRVTPAGVFTELAVPSSGASPYGITSGPDGNVWFVESSGNRIGKVTTGGTFTEYAISTPLSYPAAITAGPNGNLWFVEQQGSVGEITTGGTITEFTIPSPGASPYGITSGSDGNLWFTEGSVNKIGRIPPQ